MRNDEVSSPKSNLSNWQYFWLLVIMIGSAVLFIWTISGALVEAGPIFWLIAGITYLVTPYAYCAGNQGTLLPRLGKFVNALVWWTLMLIFCFVAAEFLLTVVKPMLLGLPG